MDEFEVAAAPAAEEVGELDFGTAHDEADEMIDFGQPQPAMAAADDDEIVPDFGDPIAAEPMELATPIPVVPAEKTGKKGKEKKVKEKKEKKPRAPKPPADGTRKRSLVGTLAVYVLPSVILIPGILLGAGWLSPAYDFFGLFSKKPKNQVAMVPPPQTMPQPGATEPARRRRTRDS